MLKVVNEINRLHIYLNEKKPPRHLDEVEKILIFKVYNSNMKSFAKILKI